MNFFQTLQNGVKKGDQLNPLSANPQNGQTHLNNSSQQLTNCFSLRDHFVELALRELSIF